MKLRTAILVVICLAASWYFVLGFLSGLCFGNKCGVIYDFYPMWNASRALMQHVDPYGPEVTLQNQIMAYGATAKEAGLNNEQRFAYPIYATFPLFPLQWLDFQTANQVALWLFAALTALSVGWLRGQWNITTLLYGLLTFSSYPVILALQLRQPTLLFFALAVGSFAMLRSGRLIPAALLAALSAGKPQIALAVVLPMLVWTFAQWRERKRFLIWLTIFFLGLVCLSSLISPRWIPEWLSTLHAYSQYTRPPVMISLLGNKIGLVVSGFLLLGLIAALWVHRRSDLLFQVALSVVIIELITPQALYTAVILLIPATWVADNAHSIALGGVISQLSLTAARIALIEFWLANVVGAVLLHTSHLGQSIAWLLPVFVNRALVWCLVVVMVVQLFCRGSATERKESSEPAHGQPGTSVDAAILNTQCAITP